VLLIPHLQSDNVALAPSSKRKRTKIRPQPALLDKILLERLYNIKLAKEEQGDYLTLCGLKFEYDSFENPSTFFQLNRTC